MPELDWGRAGDEVKTQSRFAAIYPFEFDRPDVQSNAQRRNSALTASTTMAPVTRELQACERAATAPASTRPPRPGGAGQNAKSRSPRSGDAVSEGVAAASQVEEEEEEEEGEEGQAAAAEAGFAAGEQEGPHRRCLLAAPALLAADQLARPDGSWAGCRPHRRAVEGCRADPETTVRQAPAPDHRVPPEAPVL